MEYSEIEAKIINKLEKTKFAVLATSDNDQNLSASQICIINDGLNVYIQTDSKFEKAKNIKVNNKIALNLGDYYFKGLAEIIGHPTDNEKFIELIKQKHPQTYNSYTNLKDEILIKITLTECKIWGLDNYKTIHNQETITIVDLINKNIKYIICDKNSD